MPSYWSLEEPATLNDMTALPRAGRWESQTLGDQRATIINETQGGVRYGYQLFERESLPGIIFEFPQAVASQYRAISRATQGRVKPFYFLLDGDDFNASPPVLLYCRLEEDDFTPEVFGPGMYSTTLQQWFRWVMRVSAEVEDQPLED